MSALGEYAVKTVAAGMALIKMLGFLKTEDESLVLTRAEVEAIIMTIREQATELKLRNIRGRQR